MPTLAPVPARRGFTAPTTRTFALRIAVALVTPCTVAVRAQHPALAPTSDTTIVVPSGSLHYSSIQIPTGVTVKFVAPGYGPGSSPGMPAIVFCDGDAVVHGTLSVSGDTVNDRPAGWVTTGRGTRGLSCASAVTTPPTGGLHGGTYGSVLPFSLDGGSLGGDLDSYSDPVCTQYANTVMGGKGGGTLVLLAGGSILIPGTVTADGLGGWAGGSGGSILLRGHGGVTVQPTGSVTARGGTAPLASPPHPPQISFGAPGFVRLDAWGTRPDIQGTVDPPPTLLELPHLRQVSVLQTGRTWVLEVYAPDNTPVLFAASLTPGSGVPTPFGPLGLDLVTAAGIAVVVAPSGHDPFATVSWPVPHSLPLLGLHVWVQALAVPAGLPPRLTNTLAAVVQ